MDENPPKVGPARTAAFLRAMANGFPLAFYVADERSGQVLYANRRFFDLWGLDALEQSLHRDDLADSRVRDAIRLLLKDGSTCLKSASPPSHDDPSAMEEKLPLSDGRTIRHISTPICDGDDIHRGRLHSFEDITDRKCEADVLQQSRGRYESLIQSIEGMVCEADPDTFQMTFMSRHCERVLGYPVDQWTAVPGFWESRIHPEDRDRAVASCLLAVRERRPNDFGYRLIGADGQIVWVRDLVTVEVDGDRCIRLRGIMVEQQLLDSQAFTLSVIENIPDMVFVKDARDLRFLRLNKAGERLLGYTKEEVIGKNDYDLFPRDEADFRTAMDRATLQSGRLADIFEERIRTKLHGERLLHTKRLPIMNSAGEPQYLLGISEDVTEYRQAREALRESEERFRSFMDHTPALAWLKDEQGRYVYANRKWQEQLGFSRDEWRHLTDEMIHCPDIARQCRDGDKAVLASGKSYEGIEFSTDATGTPRCWWVWKFPFQGGKGTRYVGGIAIDVTERTQAERSLQESEQRYHALYEDNPTMYFTLAIDGTVLSVNRYGAGQLGYAPHELTGRSVLQVFHREDHAQVLEQLAACQKNVTKTITWELRKVRKDGTGLWVRECARAVPDPKGDLVVLVVCEDITERKLAEKALLKAQARMQAIQEERERLAHDLHDNIIQRLYAIGMTLEEGRYRINEGIRALSLTALLARTIDELNLVIEDVRNFIGGKDPLHLVNASTVAAQFRKLGRKASRGPAIAVHIEEGDTKQMSSLEAKNLYLIAREAVSNILRHSRATNGSVQLRTEHDSHVLIIQDDGIGFDPARAAAGRLGLKTMRARAKKIGARFKLRTHERKGTVITVKLPKGSTQDEQNGRSHDSRPSRRRS
jgi:PAS domain S-box-containing protein